MGIAGERNQWANHAAARRDGLKQNPTTCCDAIISVLESGLINAHTTRPNTLKIYTSTSSTLPNQHDKRLSPFVFPPLFVHEDQDSNGDSYYCDETGYKGSTEPTFRMPARRRLQSNTRLCPLSHPSPKAATRSQVDQPYDRLG